jgi:hypothetical protein
MPLRGLFYFAQLYQKEVAKRKLDIFGRSRVKIPSPKFVVFYNGAQEQKDIVKYRLSDLFEVKDESGDFEWTATVININKNHNESLQKKCQSLYHYCVFVERVKENLDKKMEPKDAVNEAVDFAIRGNFLEGYFKEQRMNIVGNRGCFVTKLFRTPTFEIYLFQASASFLASSYGFPAPATAETTKNPPTPVSLRG